MCGLCVCVCVEGSEITLRKGNFPFRSARRWVQKIGLPVRSHFLFVLLEKKLNVGVLFSATLASLSTYVSISWLSITSLPTCVCLCVTRWKLAPRDKAVGEESALSYVCLRLCHLCHVRCRASPLACLSLSFLICEMREIAMTSQVLSEVGYIDSFSEILRKIILLQKTLQNK